MSWLTGLFSDLDDGTAAILRMRCDSPNHSPTIEVSLSIPYGLVTDITVLYDHLESGESKTPLLITDPTPFKYHWSILDECAHDFGDTLRSVSVRVRTKEDVLRDLAPPIVGDMAWMQSAGKLVLYYAEPLKGYRWEDDMIRDLWKFKWQKWDMSTDLSELLRVS